MNDGRKLIEKFENPIDNILIDICTKINQKLNPDFISPNMLTSFSLIFGITSAILVYKSFFLQSAFTWTISYFLDCLDGNFARMHNKCTQFGDTFDHMSDKIREIAMILAVIFNKKITTLDKIITLGLVALFLIPMYIHLGCQEKIANSSSKCLGYLKNLCRNTKFIKITRFFGCGTINLLVVIILIYFYFTYNK